MKTALLTIDIQAYWHPGTGRGSGFHLDAITHTGADGLPRLPGRTLKGLLRDAVHRAELWGWPRVPAGTTVALFGSRTNPGRVATADPPVTPQPRRDENLSTPGLLRVSDATLPAEVATYLASEDGKKLVPGLYREHFSTAIDAATGVAQGRSLRGMQVVVPLMLEARIDEVSGIASVPDWRALLETVFALIPAVGAHRTRGFGRAHLCWKKD